MVNMILLVWLLVWNTAAFLMMGIDKRRAKKGKYRIPEKTLFLSAILGGTPGAMAGMNFFRHKTKHKAFVIGMPAIFIFQALIAFILTYWKQIF